MTKTLINYFYILHLLGFLLIKPTIAAPDNFNPGLRLNTNENTVNSDRQEIIITSPNSTKSPPQNLPQEKDTEITEESENKTPKITFENTTNDSLKTTDNNGQINQYTHQTFNFKLNNGDTLAITSGYESYQQTGIEDVNNIPLKLTWQGKKGPVNLSAGIGIDFFDRLSSSYGFNASISGQPSEGLNLSGIVEFGPYKFNAKTLESEITAWRYGPNVYWQISKDVSFFSLFRVGNYSDGNVENQSFSRLEKKFGQFAVAANLFTWGYSQDLNEENGYFSPSDFLVYTGELSWTGEIFTDLLKCRLAVAIGEQRLNGDSSGADTYEGLCTIKFAPNLEADFGYSYSNIRSTDNQINKPIEKFIGKFRWAF
ncbi:MAG: hypothetical protein GFH26_640259n37 [Chloroflexi bacterium AL-N15]|nr:hypothetical protein [Chloroflexi bacterium AL-N15]